MPRQTDRASSSSTATLQKRYSTNTGHKACLKPDLPGPAGDPSPGLLNHWFRLRLPPVKNLPQALVLLCLQKRSYASLFVPRVPDDLHYSGYLRRKHPAGAPCAALSTLRIFGVFCEAPAPGIMSFSIALSGWQGNYHHAVSM
ncbi:unnamed protein product [Lepidochelys kempii]